MDTLHSSCLAASEAFLNETHHDHTKRITENVQPIEIKWQLLSSSELAQRVYARLTRTTAAPDKPLGNGAHNLDSRIPEYVVATYIHEWYVCLRDEDNDEGKIRTEIAALELHSYVFPLAQKEARTHNFEQRGTLTLFEITNELTNQTCTLTFRKVKRDQVKDPYAFQKVIGYELDHAVTTLGRDIGRRNDRTIPLGQDELTETEFSDPKANPERSVLCPELQKQLGLHFEELYLRNQKANDQLRVVFRSLLIQNSNLDIALELGLTTKQVEQKKFRGLRKLRDNAEIVQLLKDFVDSGCGGLQEWSLNCA